MKQSKEKSKPYQNSLKRNFIQDYFLKSQGSRYSQRQNQTKLCRGQGRNVQTMPSVIRSDKLVPIVWKSTTENRNMKPHEDNMPGSKQDYKTVRKLIKMLALKQFKN